MCTCTNYNFANSEKYVAGNSIAGNESSSFSQEKKEKILDTSNNNLYLALINKTFLLIFARNSIDIVKFSHTN